MVMKIINPYISSNNFELEIGMDYFHGQISSIFLTLLIKADD